MMPQAAWKMLTVLSVGVVWLGLPQESSAQGNSLFSGSGLTSRGTGGISGGLSGGGFSSGGGRGATGSSGLSGGGLGGMSGGLGGGLGGLSGGLGQGGGRGGAGGASGLGANPFGNTGGANAGMVGRNSGAFAGNSRANQSGAQGRGNTRTFNNAGRGNAGNMNQNGGGQSERTTSSIRPRQKVAFEYAQKSPTVVASRINQRMAKISTKNPALSGVIIHVDGDELVLMGQVKTEEQGRLVANLLRLEPGVRSIRNELEIKQPSLDLE